MIVWGNFSRCKTERQLRLEQLLQPLSFHALAHHLLCTSVLLSNHLLLHNKVIKVSSRVDCSVFVQTTILHELCNLFYEFSPHANDLIPRHFVLPILQVIGCIRKASCFKQSKNHLCVSAWLHAHQALVVNRDWKLVSLREKLLCMLEFFPDILLVIFSRL